MRLPWIPCVLVALAACGAPESEGAAGTDAMGQDPAAEQGAESAGPAAEGALPASADEAQARLASSPRHGEWVTIRSDADSIRAWVVYPERSDPAPVVVVVHEIFGLSNWIRAVADQLAADGFIAIAPDLMTMRNIPLAADGAPDPEVARREIQSLDPDAVHRHLLAVAEYGMALPAALPRYGIVGFCWGGAVSFEHAIRSPALGASVVYYGTSPDTALLASIEAPVLGLYGGNDERVNATVPGAEATMARLGKRYETETYEGAGHGFLRAQEGQGGANLEATRAAWPRTIEWFRENLEG